jgi:hypothetical protein
VFPVLSVIAVAIFSLPVVAKIAVILFFPLSRSHAYQLSRSPALPLSSYQAIGLTRYPVFPSSSGFSSFFPVLRLIPFSWRRPHHPDLTRHCSRAALAVIFIVASSPLS